MGFFWLVGWLVFVFFFFFLNSFCFGSSVLGLQSQIRLLSTESGRRVTQGVLQLAAVQ